jgi:hypothetical protein
MFHPHPVSSSVISTVLTIQADKDVTRLNAMLASTIDSISLNTTDEAIRGRFIAFTEAMGLDLTQQAPSEEALRYYLSDELGNGPLSKSKTLAKQVGLQWISTCSELDDALDAHLTSLVSASGLPTSNASAN